MTDARPRKFVERNVEASKMKSRNVTVNNSTNDRVEQTTDIIVDERLKFGIHNYISIFVHANFRYDVILGMPWNVASNRKVSYPARKARLKDGILPVRKGVKKTFLKWPTFTI
jgi:hypothetical protein